DELLAGVIGELSTSDVRHGYAEDVRAPLQQIDELLDRIRDLYKRSSAKRDLDFQTAEDGLRRWKDAAYKVLVPIIGDDEAAELTRCVREYRGETPMGLSKSNSPCTSSIF